MLYVLDTENLNTGSNEVGMESTYLTFNDFFLSETKIARKVFFTCKTERLGQPVEESGQNSPKQNISKIGQTTMNYKIFLKNVTYKSRTNRVESKLGLKITQRQGRQKIIYNKNKTLTTRIM